MYVWLADEYGIREVEECEGRYSGVVGLHVCDASNIIAGRVAANLHV